MSERQLQAQIISRQSSRSDIFSACVILSDDTYVFIILLYNALLHRMGIQQVLNDTAHCVDEAIAALGEQGFQSEVCVCCTAWLAATSDLHYSD